MKLKWNSKTEVITLVVILFILASTGISGGLALIGSLKVIGINLFEMLAAKHITFFIVKLIMVTFSFLGIWIGRENGKFVFGSILLLVSALLF